MTFGAGLTRKLARNTPSSDWVEEPPLSMSRTLNRPRCSLSFVPGKPIPDSKVHGANMGPMWGRQDPDGPHVGPMILSGKIWEHYGHNQCHKSRETPVPHPKIHRIESEMWTFLIRSSVLWDVGKVHFRICRTCTMRGTNTLITAKATTHMKSLSYCTTQSYSF